MSKTIWKYPLPNPVKAFNAPCGAVPLCVQIQHGDPTLWMEVDPDQLKQGYVATFYGTGHTLPDEPGRYVGTVQMEGGALVFHLYLKEGA